jgi:hypothetical protein
MASIMLKDIPPELHGQLKQEAEANYRSLTQEALARIERSFQMDEVFTTKPVQAWIDGALASGPEAPVSRQKFNAAFRRAAKRFQSRTKAQCLEILPAG